MKRRNHRRTKPTQNAEILEAYLRKTAPTKYDARRIHRQMRRLFFATR